jgi:N-acetylmuramoyl-L-alanine amidase
MKTLTGSTFCIFVIMAVGIIFSLPDQIFCAENPFIDDIKTVVLDPGHGGYDHGAKGPAGTLEKNVTLGLAQLMADQLKKNYKMILTRSDDYWVDIPGRTAVANHQKADLFISIHTGGSFLHQAKGINIYYYKELSGYTLETGDDLPKPGSRAHSQVLWEHIQTKHIPSSKLLADIMHNRLNSGLEFFKSKIDSADMMVLKGADMPAILIEVGYLTNPTDEENLQSPEALADVAKAICAGIDEYFQNSKR